MLGYGCGVDVDRRDILLDFFLQGVFYRVVGFKPRWELREVQGLDGEVPYDGIDTIGVVSKTFWTVLGDIGSRAHDVLVLASQLTSVDKGLAFLVA